MPNRRASSRPAYPRRTERSAPSKLVLRSLEGNLRRKGAIHFKKAIRIKDHCLKSDRTISPPDFVQAYHAKLDPTQNLSQRIPA